MSNIHPKQLAGFARAVALGGALLVATVTTAAAQPAERAPSETGGHWWFFAMEAGIVLIVFLGLPIIARCCGRTDEKESRGLGLPRGSIRGMLALFIVGSTVNFLLFGSSVAGQYFSEVVAALSTLSASVIGFYFGGRTATPLPRKESAPSEDDGNTGEPAAKPQGGPQ